MRICFCTKTSANADDMLIRRVYYLHYLRKKTPHLLKSTFMPSLEVVLLINFIGNVTKKKMRKIKSQLIDNKEKC